MNLFKRFGIAIVAILFMFVGTAPAFALDVIDEGVLRDDNGQTFFIPTQAGDTSYNWVGLKTSDGRVAYCYDVTLTWPSDGDSIDYSDTIDQLDPGVIYILENGAVDPIHPSKQERWVTQGAIWLYRTNGTRFETDYIDTYNLFARMLELVEGAKQAKINGNVNSGVINGIQLTNDNLTLDGDYYISSDITPDVKGVDYYNVSLSGVTGAEVVSNSGSTIPAGSSFKVRVPASNMSDKVTVTVSIQTKAFIINPSNNGFQRVVSLNDITRTVSETVELSPKVCVDYKIVGNVIPDASLTDPTPGKSCFEKDTSYNQEEELTTRTNCTFKGWFTKEELTGKWIDGTALSNDMTLYGAWDCPVIQVPPTAASSSLIVIGFALVSIAICGGLYFFKVKKQNS